MKFLNKMIPRYIALIIVIQFGYINCLSLPTYISKCSLKDGRLWECLARTANDAIPRIVKGDKHYNIPSMCPLEISSTIILRNDEDLKFILQNVKIYGLEDTLVSTMFFDGKFFESVFINPGLKIVADYEILGNILNHNIFGHGPANITLDQIIFKFNMTLQRRNSHGEIFFDVKEPSLSYETIRTIYNLENLFCGAKFLGDEMNNILNKNWSEIQVLFQPIASKAMSDSMHKIISNYLSNVPINEMFKP